MVSDFGCSTGNVEHAWKEHEHDTVESDVKQNFPTYGPRTRIAPAANYSIIYFACASLVNPNYK